MYFCLSGVLAQNWQVKKENTALTADQTKPITFLCCQWHFSHRCVISNMCAPFWCFEWLFLLLHEHLTSILREPVSCRPHTRKELYKRCWLLEIAPCSLTEFSCLGFQCSVQPFVCKPALLMSRTIAQEYLSMQSVLMSDFPSLCIVDI